MTEANRWNIRQVYLYLVCFATLMILIIGTVQLIMGVVDLVYPNPRTGYFDIRMNIAAEYQKQNPDATQEDIDKQVQAELERQEASQRYYQVRGFINSLIMVFVSLPVYLYHWRKIQSGEGKPA